MIKVVNNVVEVEGISIQFDSVESANSFLLDYISKHGQEVKVVEVKKEEVVVGVFYDLILNFGDIEIENLDLSVRSYNCLKRGGINYIADILKLGYEDVVRIRNLGSRSVLEVQSVVNEYIRYDYIKWSDDLIVV